MTSRRLEEELECPICLDRFDTPKVLPCQHTFCSHCIDGLNTRGSVPCPECRRIHPVPAGGFPINITMQRLLSASETPNNPSLNVPRRDPAVSSTPLHPSAPPIQPPSSGLHPVYLPQQPNHPTHSQLATNNAGGSQGPRVIPSEDEPDGDNFDQCKTFFLKYFKITRKAVRKVISTFLKKYKNFMAVSTFMFMIITFSRFVAGAVKLSSDCPEEKRVGEYLFVKSIFGFLFWGMLLLLGCKKELTKAMDNRFVEVYLVIESVFSLIWLIIGTVWIMGERQEMIEECQLHIDGWDKHFINFASFLTSVDWICLVAFGFYCCYVQCDNSPDDELT